MVSDIINVENLVKVYPGGTRAVDGISFSVRERVLRVPRPERCGKEHDDPGSHDTAEEDLWFCDRCWLRC